MAYEACFFQESIIVYTVAQQAIVLGWASTTFMPGTWYAIDASRFKRRAQVPSRPRLQDLDDGSASSREDQDPEPLRPYCAGGKRGSIWVGAGPTRRSSRAGCQV